jgi:predicted alpha/beta hydrolase family esterase
MFDNSPEKVKDHAEDIVCYYSDNDPYVKQEAEEDFANKVSNKQIVISGGGHLNKGAGYTEFKELLDYIG